MKKNALYKGTLQNIILKLLASEVKMYGYQLTQRAKELTKGELEMTEGALYPLLTRLKNGEFLAYRWEESTSGPPRKYYQITDKGKTFLTELLNTWNELTESVNQITKTS
jgi:PadR family transcriptional regulator PadR